MSDWREENFLERLANRSAEYDGAWLCPEAETLCGGTEPGSKEPISETLSHHLESCPVCSELRRRLFLFDQSLGFGLDPDAKEAEKRLDSWMKGFLASRALIATIPRVESAPKIITYPSVPRTRLSSKLQWVLAAAAVVTITVGVVYTRRSIVALTPTTEMARAKADEAAPVPTPTDVQSPPETPSVEPERPAAHAPRMSQEPKRSKIESPAKTGTAPVSRPEIATAPEQPIRTASETAPPVAAETPAVAENAPGATASIPIHPVVPPARVSFSPGAPVTSAAEADIGCATCVGVSSVPRLIAAPPIQIPAGTRIWISIDSTTPQSAGHFRFEGTLLLPVSASNAVILEKGISVFGLGTANAKRTVFQITGFVFRGSNYSSTTDPGAIALQAAASGRVVEFQSGKVAEMWLDSLSTFSATSPNSGSRASARRPGLSQAAGVAAKAAPTSKSTNPP